MIIHPTARPRAGAPARPAYIPASAMNVIVKRHRSAAEAEPEMQIEELSSAEQQRNDPSEPRSKKPRSTKKSKGNRDQHHGGVPLLRRSTTTTGLDDVAAPVVVLPAADHHDSSMAALLECAKEYVGQEDGAELDKSLQALLQRNEENEHEEHEQEPELETEKTGSLPLSGASKKVKDEMSSCSAFARECHQFSSVADAFERLRSALPLYALGTSSSTSSRTATADHRDQLPPQPGAFVKTVLRYLSNKTVAGALSRGPHHALQALSPAARRLVAVLSASVKKKPWRNVDPSFFQFLRTLDDLFFEDLLAQCDNDGRRRERAAVEPQQAHLCAASAHDFYSRVAARISSSRRSENWGDEEEQMKQRQRLYAELGFTAQDAAEHTNVDEVGTSSRWNPAMQFYTARLTEFLHYRKHLERLWARENAAGQSGQRQRETTNVGSSLDSTAPPYNAPTAGAERERGPGFQKGVDALRRMHCDVTRDWAARAYSFAVPTVAGLQHVLDVVAGSSNTRTSIKLQFIEVGAGLGYWAEFLQRNFANKNKNSSGAATSSLSVAEVRAFDVMPPDASLPPPFLLHVDEQRESTVEACREDFSGIRCVPRRMRKKQNGTRVAPENMELAIGGMRSASTSNGAGAAASCTAANATSSLKDLLEGNRGEELLHDQHPHDCDQMQMKKKKLKVKTKAPSDIQLPPGATSTFTEPGAKRKDFLAQRCLLLCFPPPSEPMAARSVAAFTGEWVLYVGEWRTGMTGDAGFHDLLQQEFALRCTVPLPQWSTTCYAMFLFRRKIRAPADGAVDEVPAEVVSSINNERDKLKFSIGGALSKSLQTTTSAASPSASSSAPGGVVREDDKNRRPEAEPLPHWRCASCAEALRGESEGPLRAEVGAVVAGLGNRSRSLFRCVGANRGLVACSECRFSALNKDVLSGLFYGAGTTTFIGSAESLTAPAPAPSWSRKKHTEERFWEPIEFATATDQRAWLALARATPQA